MSKRLFLLLLSAVGGALLLLLLLFFLYATDLIVRQTQARALDLIALLEGELVDDASSGQELVLRFDAHLRSFVPARIVIVDEEGTLLADSGSGTPEVQGRYINAVISEAKSKEFATTVLRDALRDSMTVSVARKVQSAEGSVIVAVSIKIMEAGRLGRLYFAWLVLLLAVLFALVSLVVRYSLDRYQRPIVKLVQHTRDAAGGRGMRISPNPAIKGEFAELIENFNALAEGHKLLIEADNKKYSRIFTLLANLTTGIVMVEPDNAVVLANPMAEKLLCLDKRELFKDQAAAGRNNSLLADLLNATAEVNRSREGRSLTLNGAGDTVLDLTIETIHSKYAPYAHSGALAIIQDVTEMRRLEKLKDQFIANVSHELRTPLTVIAGFVETLQSWEKLSESDRKSALGIIDLETERLSRLISELLHLSRIDSGIPRGGQELFDPLPLVGNVLDSLEAFREKRGIRLRTRLTEEPVGLSGVPGWFRQIVYNIYENALKYTPREGIVEIFLDRGGARGRELGKESLVLAVADSGPGIPEEERERVFDRFYQLNPSATSKNPGSGLGLAIAKEMTVRFGGTIKIGASTHGGATITLTIPLDKELL